MRISDWSSDVCSSDLHHPRPHGSIRADGLFPRVDGRYLPTVFRHADRLDRVLGAIGADAHSRAVCDFSQAARTRKPSQGELAHAANRSLRSEEHTSELQSLMRISYAVFCLKKK